jgi:hypothetical protein
VRPLRVTLELDATSSLLAVCFTWRVLVPRVYSTLRTRHSGR